MEQRELHAFQEEMQRGLSAEGDGVASPPSSPHRRPIYVEKATQRSVDIAIENVTLPRQQQMEAGKIALTIYVSGDFLSSNNAAILKKIGN